MKQPDFMIHTGDITQSSKPAEFDTAEQVIKGRKDGTGILRSRRA